MSLLDFFGAFPFLVPVLVIVIVAVALGAYKFIKEWLPW
jgi:hypothetical protein